VVGLLLLVVVAVAAYLLGRDPHSAKLPTDRPGGDRTSVGADTRADTAAALLDQLGRRLTRGSRAQLIELAAPGDPEATAELSTLRDNVRSLRIAGLDLRYVDESQEQPTEDQRRRFGDRVWLGDVQLSWLMSGYDRRPGHREVALTFTETPHGAAFVSARGDADGPTPLWLLERVSSSRSGHSLVVTAGARSPARFSRLADRAVADVRKVLHGWRGRLVVEVPGDEQQLGRVLGASQDAYGGIAAVTTTVDGSLSPGAPVHIFLNPAVFGPLGPRGAQIVMSHEATHVATGAAVSSMPTWLLEGFADYVALAHVDLPVSVTGSQILARVRRAGAPRQLPGQQEFDPRNKALGASYESAWLACRLLGERYGERRLVAFYRAADRSGSTAGPFRSLLGTDQVAFTRSWRRYLEQLAG
jgi:hypothetical protein